MTRTSVGGYRRRVDVVNVNVRSRGQDLVGNGSVGVPSGKRMNFRSECIVEETP